MQGIVSSSWVFLNINWLSAKIRVPLWNSFIFPIQFLAFGENWAKCVFRTLKINLSPYDQTFSKIKTQNEIFTQLCVRIENERIKFLTTLSKRANCYTKGSHYYRERFCQWERPLKYGQGRCHGVNVTTLACLLDRHLRLDALQRPKLKLTIKYVL